MDCAINLTFSPTASGSTTATLTVTDNAPGSPQSVQPSGTGQVPDITLAVSSGSPASATLTASESATYKVTVTPQGGLSGTIGLTCSGGPLEATCSVIPESLNLCGSASVPVTVTMSTTVGSAIWFRPKPSADLRLWVSSLAILSALGAAATRGRRLASKRACIVVGLSVLGLALSAGCGESGASGGSGRTPAATYILTVAGSITSVTGMLQHNVALTLTVV